MSEIEVIFERLSSQYLNKINEERKKFDDLQLQAINNSLREWSNKFHSHNTALTTNNNNGGIIGSNNDQDLLKDALSEAKDRQGKIISVNSLLFLEISFCCCNLCLLFRLGNERSSSTTT